MSKSRKVPAKESRSSRAPSSPRSTVRRISYGVGCEKVFPLHAPNVVDVECVRHGKVRRAKLYYLRDRLGKAAKVKEKV